MGTIRKRGNRYQAQIRRKDYGAIGKSFGTKKDAEKWMRQTEAQLERGEISIEAPSPYRLGMLMRRYRDEVTAHKKGHITEARRIERLLRDPISKQRLSDLTSAVIANFRDRRMQDGIRAAQYDLILIRHAIDIGRREWGIKLPYNPVNDVRIPNGIRRRERRLEAGEWDALQKASEVCVNPLTWPAVQFAVATAMRRSEILKLSWQDIDLKNRLALLHNTKNGNARSVPLSDSAIAIIDTLPQNTPHLFPVSDDALRQSWERLVKRAEIKNLRFHDLRHEAISRFFEAGLSIPEVAMISGHKDYRVLFRYTHLRPADLVRKISTL